MIKEQKTLTVTDILGNAFNTPLLSNEEEIRMAKKVREGDETAIEEFKQCNARFVAAVAKQYTDRGMTIDELMEAGNDGLIEAARKYNENDGFKFISYAVWRIRQHILQALFSATAN